MSGPAPRLSGLLIVSALTVLRAAAAEPPAASPGIPPVGLAANEQQLWLTLLEGQRTLAARRTNVVPFAAQPELNGVVGDFALAGDDAIVILADGTVYEHDPSGWTRGRDLPGRARPVSLANGPDGAFALIRAATSAELPAADDAERHAEEQNAATRPFDPGGSSIVLVRYAARRWVPIAACPRELHDRQPPRLRPRVLHVLGDLRLFWFDEGERLHTAVLNPRTGEWTADLPPLSAPEATGFWPVVVNRVPTVVFAVPSADGGEQLAVFRLPRADELARGASYQRQDAEFAETQPARRRAFAQAAAFNQQLAVLALEGPQQASVYFLRAGAAPMIESVDVVPLFRTLFAVPRGQGELQTLSVVVPVLVFALLLAFRRNALFSAAALPAGLAPAFAFQRVVGGLIDLAPFVFITAAALDVNWREGLSDLATWAFSFDTSKSRIPSAAVFVWWMSAAAMYASYALILEAISGRTVGKVLMRVRVATESGRRAPLLRIVVRSVVRLVELLPPMWVLIFLIVLSRNRQRLGDLFAGTVVVRTIEEEPDRPEPAERDGASGDDSSHDDA